MPKNRAVTNAINQSEFVELIAQKGYTKRDAKQLVKDVVATLKECMVGGTGVTLTGFGTFAVVHIEGREMKCGIANSDGGRMYVPEHNCPKFYASPNLKRAMRDYDLDNDE